MASTLHQGEQTGRPGASANRYGARSPIGGRALFVRCDHGQRTEPARYWQPVLAGRSKRTRRILGSIPSAGAPLRHDSRVF
jgi:hypothetical protein